MFTTDGLDSSGNIVPGSADISPNPDAIEEVSVQTNTFKVEERKKTSILAAITTKSGTNESQGTGSYVFGIQNFWAQTIASAAGGIVRRLRHAGALALGT